MTTKIHELGDILVVGAHPDDEVFMAGGLMAAAVLAGQRVACITATHGEAGVRDERRWPRTKLAEIRTRELERSLEVVGVHEHRWLDYLDGECAAAKEHEAVEKLREVVEEFRPDTILTFGPDGLTGHPDHRAVGRWAALAVAGTKVWVLWTTLEREQYEQLRVADRAGNIFFLGKPEPVSADRLAVDFRLSKELTEVKRRAFEQVESQFEEILSTHPFAHPGEGLARECFVEGNNG